MAKKRLGVGFIGAGFITRFHIRSWIGVRDADILGIVSRTEERAEEAAALARELNVGEAKAYKSVTDMVADPNIDAIWICAPNFSRLENMEEIVNALEMGKGEFRSRLDKFERPLSDWKQNGFIPMLFRCLLMSFLPLQEKCKALVLFASYVFQQSQALQNRVKELLLRWS